MDQQYNKLTDEYNQSFTESGQARQKRALERYFNMTDKFRKEQKIKGDIAYKKMMEGREKIKQLESLTGATSVQKKIIEKKIKKIKEKEEDLKNQYHDAQKPYVKTAKDIEDDKKIEKENKKEIQKEMIDKFVKKRKTNEKGRIMEALKENVKSSKEEKAEAKRLLKEEKAEAKRLLKEEQEKAKAKPVKAVKYSVAKFKELEKKLKYSVLAIQKRINQGEDGKELTKAKEEYNELLSKYKEMKEHTDKIKTKPFSAVLIKTITKIEGHIHGDHIVDSKISSDMAVSEKAKYKKHIDDAVNELKELLETKYPSEESESSSSDSESDEDEKPKKKKPKKKTDDDEPVKPRGRPKKITPNSKPEGYVPSGKARNEAKAAALKEQENMEREQAGKAPLQKRGRKPKDFIPEPVVEKKGRAPKGSQEAKDKMAAIRAKRQTKNANVIR